MQDKLKKSEEFIRQAERLLERSTGAELVRSTTAIDEHFNHLESALEAPNPMSPADGWATFLMNQEISQILQDSVIGRLDKTATAVNQCSVEGLRKAAVGLETKFPSDHSELPGGTVLLPRGLHFRQCNFSTRRKSWV